MASVHTANSPRSVSSSGLPVKRSYAYLRSHDAPADQVLAAAVSEGLSFGAATLRNVFGLVAKPGAVPRNFYRGLPCYSPTDCEPIPDGQLSYDELVAQGVSDKKILIAQALAENKLLGKKRLASELGLKPPVKCIPALVSDGAHLYRVSQCLPAEQVSERTKLQDELAMLNEQERTLAVPRDIQRLVSQNGVLIHARKTQNHDKWVTCFDLHGNTLIEGEISTRSKEDMDAMASALADRPCMIHAERESDPSVNGHFAQRLRARGVLLSHVTIQGTLAAALTRDTQWTDPIKLCAKLSGTALKTIEAELHGAGDAAKISRTATLRVISLLMAANEVRQARIKEIETLLTTPQDLVPQDPAPIVDGSPADPLEQERATEREACARSLEMTNAELLLMAGEMTAQELLTVQAVLKAKAAAIRRNDLRK